MSPLKLHFFIQIGRYEFTAIIQITELIPGLMSVNIGIGLDFSLL